MSLSRFANYGLMLISPIVLVRLLSVEEFGRYREFLVYASVVYAFATFGITSSLLYFVPRRPEHTWQFVRQATYLTLFTSSAVVAALIVADVLSGGSLVGTFLLPLSAYTLIFANVDFWEYLWLATQRPMAVFAYTTGRLVARMTVAISAAYFLRNVQAIIWSLIALEFIRLLGSVIAWNLVRADKQETPGAGWRDLLGFCLPNGGSLLLAMVNRYAANIVVAKMMGPVALAHYTIGTYVEPITSTLRNSLSDAMLPAMVNRSGSSPAEAVQLWQRGTIVASILLLPIGVLLARYAQLLILTAFSSGYHSSVPVLQIFLLVLLRECCDFAVALKAINQTRYFLYGDVLALILNLGLLTVLMPLLGLVGAVTAYVISSYAEGIFLGWWVTRLYGVPVSRFVPWRQMSKVALSCAVALLVTYVPFWSGRFALLNAAFGAMLYALAYGSMLMLLRIDEARQLADLGMRRVAAILPFGKFRLT